MSRLESIFILSLASVCLASCGNGKALDTFKGADFTFTAVSEALEGEQVPWSASAKVSVLDGVSNILYQALSSGVRPRFASDKGVNDNAMELYAVWPYSQEHELVYGGLKAQLRAEYDSVEEEAGLKIAYAAAIAQEEEMNFANVVSYLRVSLSEETGVTGLKLSGLSEEVLAGLAVIILAKDGTPVVESVPKPSRTVSLVSQTPLSGTFLIPVFPTVMENGCVLEFSNAEGCVSKIEKKEKLTFLRNGIVDFGAVGETLQWQKVPKARIQGITASEIAVSWSTSSWTDVASDFRGKYAVALYSDKACTRLVELVEWDKEGQAIPEELERLSCVFSGLQPLTDYWVKVTDKTTNASSEVIAVTTLKAEMTSVEPGKVFWSDGYINWRPHQGVPDGYNIYVDGVKANDVLLPPEVFEYHLTGLSSGREYSVVVAAVRGESEDRSEPVAVLTGSITQLTANLSPRSLSVSVENRAGGPANTVSPALYVELYEGDKPLFSSIVADGMATIHGQPFVTSLALSSEKDKRPTNVTFGRPEPSTQYKFRVKSYASYTIKDRVSSAVADVELSSPNGDSEWSEFVTFTTPP